VVPADGSQSAEIYENCRRYGWRFSESYGTRLSWRGASVEHRVAGAELARGLAGYFNSFTDTKTVPNCVEARALLLLAQYGREGTPQPTVAMIPQETLAGMVGTTRSRVNFFMNKFRKLGFIHYNGGLQVHSSLLNVVLHD
jgi:hypothetical protein